MGRYKFITLKRKIGLLQGGGMPPYIAQLQAWINYATTQGYAIPPTPTLNALNTQISSLVSSGIFTLLDILYLAKNLSGYEDFASVNVINPGTFTLLRVNAPVFSNNGWLGDGATSYLNTQWQSNPSGVNYTVNNAAVFARQENNVPIIATYLLGCNISGGTSRVSIISLAPGSVLRGTINSSDTPLAEGANALSAAFYHLYRNASNRHVMYKNGVFASSPLSTSSSLINSPLGVLANIRSDGFVSLFYYGQVSYIGAGASLAGLEATLNTLLP